MSISPFPPKPSTGTQKAERIRVQGTVQGVGFRPTVYRLAKQYGLRGEVFNDGAGVEITVVGPAAALDEFVGALRSQAPPLAQIHSITRSPYELTPTFADFTIVPSQSSTVHTVTPPDAATCPACLQDIFTPTSRFYRYPFTNCTHCGPRLSILRAIPYDRRQTSMAEFPLCPTCQAEYDTVESRRFHAQPIACPTCGPKVWLASADGAPVPPQPDAGEDDVEAASVLLLQGKIIAIKGLGGFHLACDATNERAVRRLRERKHRPHKPLALMGRDMAMIERYCQVSPEEKALLESPAAPIVLLTARGTQLPGFWWGADFLSFHRGDFADQIPHGWDASGGSPAHPAAARPSPSHKPLAPSIAPRQSTLGFMLPYTPLHHLILQRVGGPIVLTSGNLSDEPQCIDNDEARERLGSIADYWLMHDRAIVNRVDDSVVRVSGGQVQVLRRARGYAPSPIPLPKGFEAAPPLLAMGSELKNTFCLVRDGQGILSQHIGDLEDGKTYHSYEQALYLYGQIFEHRPDLIAIDLHPEYLSTKLGLVFSSLEHPPPKHPTHEDPILEKQILENTIEHLTPIKVHGIQHHHAHVAACMVENGLPLKTSPILGIALDGLGFGDDDTLWGGEFLLADYQGYRRLATFQPVAMLGGEQAIRQPWRNTYAHLKTAFDWAELTAACGDLEIITFLADKPQQTLDQILERPAYSPLASSVGRLFDAIAAAIGICREAITYEGQAAIELEALVEKVHLSRVVPYPFELSRRPEDGLWQLEPGPMWLTLLADLIQEVDPATISARFHVGLASAIATLTRTLHQHHPFTQVALTGGVFQNQILALEVKRRLEEQGLIVLTHSKVPPNDGGLSLGQAAIAAARHLQATPPNPSA